jgi:TolB-like protein/Tfp pilus assembly protein PilF
VGDNILPPVSGMYPNSSSAYRFGSFTMQVAGHYLKRGAIQIRLQPKTFETLRHLVERPGRLVTKDELFEHVWRRVAVTDGALARCIAELRKALGDDAAHPRFIETIPRLGYRFVCKVSRLHELPAAALAGVSPQQSIAVLPFVNLAADPDQEYFVDGMTDLLIADLGRLKTLRVISRTSMMRYKGTTKALADIGSELSVDAAIEGSVVRSGDRVRITVQLVAVRSDEHLWAESYERLTHDLLRLQREVASDVARAVQAALTDHKDTPQPDDVDVRPEAHEAYLRGRYFWHEGTREGVAKAVACFQQALAIDPRHAPAYVGLADASGVGGFFGYLPAHLAFPQMQTHARTALEIDPSLPDAHASLAATRLFYDWDWPGAEAGFRRALELNPNLQTAHEWYGWCLMALGRTTDALTTIARAREIDPLSMRARTASAMALYFARQHDRGIGEAERALELDPRYPPAYCALGLHHQQIGNYEAAIAAFERALALSGRGADDLASIGHAYARSGRRPKARRILQELTHLSIQRHVPAVYVAAVHAGLRDRDEALAWLARACDERSAWLPFLRVEPWWDPVRSDPRFAGLLRRVGLPGANPRRASTRSAGRPRAARRHLGR